MHTVCRSRVAFHARIGERTSQVTRCARSLCTVVSVCHKGVAPMPLAPLSPVHACVWAKSPSPNP